MIPKVIIRSKNEPRMILDYTGIHNSIEQTYRKEKRLIEYPEFYCGECGRIMSTRSLNYCPHCGAKNEVTNKKEKDNKILEYWEDTYF